PSHRLRCYPRATWSEAGPRVALLRQGSVRDPASVATWVVEPATRCQSLSVAPARGRELKRLQNRSNDLPTAIEACQTLSWRVAPRLQVYSAWPIPSSHALAAAGTR